MSGDLRQYLRTVVDSEPVKAAIAAFRSSADHSAAPEIKSHRKFLAWVAMAHVAMRAEIGDLAGGLDPDGKVRKEQATSLNQWLQNAVPSLRPCWRKAVNVISKTYRLAALDPEYGAKLAVGDEGALAQFDERLEALTKRDPATTVMAGFDKLDKSDKILVLQTIAEAYTDAWAEAFPTDN
jgi:hypothetical protein